MALRLFAAIPIPDDIARRVVALMRGLPGARWTPAENLHVTLRFFGELDEPNAEDLDAAIDAAVAPMRPFSLRLKGAGAFGGADPHAVWIGVEDASGDLARLAEACERAARSVGLKPETRRFTPHLTVAKTRGTDLDRVMAFQARCALFESRPFDVPGFGLYSSRVRPGGPSLYRVEAEYVLAG
ncbi:MAG: RNA 2',3'-cyclic phosphodiesterase [Alphaproteobacteria bacterium]|nr:RNA 2',3'-cyclic phosphodiesterase [Alphaproteobacteria bacterium]